MPDKLRKLLLYTLSALYPIYTLLNPYYTLLAPLRPPPVPLRPPHAPVPLLLIRSWSLMVVVLVLSLSDLPNEKPCEQTADKL